VNTQPVATGGRTTRVVVATTVMLSFISFWRAAAIVLNDLGSSAYYVGGIAEQAIGKSAPWFILGIMLFSYAVRAVYVESCAMFTRGGVYRVVKEAMGGTLAKLSVSALMFDYILTGPISGVSAGQYITGLIAKLLTYWHHPWNPSNETINLCAAGFALVITIYFWWRNTKGIHESSDDALKIMYITTVMVVLLIAWCLLTIAINHDMQRLPPMPWPHNLAFDKDAVGWLPKIAPHALRPVASEADGTPRFGLVQNASGLLGLIGILIAFGHSFLAMSGEESLAQVNRELEHPKHKNLMRAGLVIFVYSLVFTSLVSFFAYAMIPDNERYKYLDNLISGISIHLTGPESLKLIFNAFIVIVGFLMLAGAINTSIIGANGVLNRVSEDGVMPDWFRAPHKRYGTTFRMINLIVILQIISIIGSRGDTYALGEAYAFGVIWSFAFKGLAMLVLRFKDRTPREWKVPFNIHFGDKEWPVGLTVIAILLFAVAAINLITKQVATVTGLAFTAVFFILFTSSEKLLERKRTEKHVEVDAFQLQPQNTVTSQSVGVRPGHLQRALEFTDTTKRDLVVMTANVSKGADAGYENIDQNELFTSYEQMLFSRVVHLAERAGKTVSLLVVPSNDLEQAITRTAVNLNSTEIIAGPSSTVSPDDQARRLGQAWEQMSDQPRQQIRYRIIKEDGSINEYLLGAHAPNLDDRDVSLIHNLWLNVTQETQCDKVHHRDVVALALTRLEQDLNGIERGGVLAEMRCLTATEPIVAAETAQSTAPFVVGVFGTEADLHAVDLAAQFGQAVGAQVHLTFPYVVPRNMPLAPVAGPEREEIEAQLRRLEGAVRARELDATIHIEPTRNAARCLVQVATETHAAMIVLALPADRPEDLVEIADEVRALASCEVMVASQPVSRSAMLAGATGTLR
jgi:amino acid transporter